MNTARRDASGPQTERAGRMAIRIYPSREELGRAAAGEAAAALRSVISKKGACAAVFAAAPSQNEFLEALAEAAVDWTKVTAFHMDEYIGLPPDAPQGFGNFLRRAIFDRLPFGRVQYIDGGNQPAAEIERYSRLLRETPPDLAFMGIGENAHLAFNDPHVAHFDDTALLREVELDETCRRQQVNDGCFASLEAVPVKALTLTIPALTAADRVFCMVPGLTKAWAVNAAVTGEIRESVPASVLRMHPQAVLYLDADSSRDLPSAYRPR